MRTGGATCYVRFIGVASYKGYKDQSERHETKRFDEASCENMYHCCMKAG
jgi:hypothetical protein